MRTRTVLVSLVGLGLAAACGGLPFLEATPTPMVIYGGITPIASPVPPTEVPIETAPVETPLSPEVPVLSGPPDDVATYPGLIAYTHVSVGGVSNIHLAIPDGSNDFRLTDAPGLSLSPIWSPDARSIAYLHTLDDAGVYEIWAVNANTGETRRVTEESIDPLSTLSWSPDGRYVVYASDLPHPEVYRVDMETGEIVNLTNHPDWDHYPAWSPTGDAIAFVSDRPEEPNIGLDSIWVMDVDGSNQRYVSDEPECENLKPAWSPDGAQIAYYRWCMVGPPSDEHRDGIWVTREGEESQMLFEMSMIAPPVDPPAWSPDGRYIATGYNGDVWIVSVADGEGVNVSGLPGEEWAISWSPDSRAVIFTYYA